LGATAKVGGLLLDTPGFNPRARVGRDFRSTYYKDVVLNVSIHAPAWGATTFGGVGGSIRQVSIHAPAWGAT